MYELKNQFDFKNASDFSSLMKELTMVKTRVLGDQQQSRKRNIDMLTGKTHNLEGKQNLDENDIVRMMTQLME